MRQIYTFILAFTMSSMAFGQTYNLGVVQIGGYDFKVVAIPDFDSAGDTDLSDVGFTLMLPAGASDIVSEASALAGRTWSVDEFDAAFLTGLGLGDSTRDAFQFNMPAGQSEFAHANGQMIDLVTFSVTNMPTIGEMSFLDNSDPIATGAGGVLDSFYNSNIDVTTTQDYFGAYAPGLESFNFDTLSTIDLESTIQIKVFPNPASSLINIQATQQLDRVELFDILGKLVMTSTEIQLDVAHLKSGVYLMKLYAGHRVATKKIVIE